MSSMITKREVCVENCRLLYLRAIRWAVWDGRFFLDLAPLLPSTAAGGEPDLLHTSLDQCHQNTGNYRSHDVSMA